MVGRMVGWVMETRERNTRLLQFDSNTNIKNEI